MVSRCRSAAVSALVLGSALAHPRAAFGQEARARDVPAADAAGQDTAAPAAVELGRAPAENRGGARFVIAANTSNFLMLGGDVPLPHTRWAVHARLSVFVAVAPLASIGARRPIAVTESTETNLLVAVGALSCQSFLDGPCPIDGGAAEEYRAAAGAAIQVVAWGLGGSDRWAAGPEVAFWRRFSRRGDPGFDLWTLGLVIERRLSP